MHKLSSRLKRRVLKLLCESCSNLVLLCLKANYARLRNIARSTKPRTPKKKLAHMINSLIRKTVYSIISKYCDEPKIIVDMELEDIMQIRTHEPREPIELADVVAWFNLRSSNMPREIRMQSKRHIIELDIENKLVRLLHRRAKKQQNYLKENHHT